MNDNFRYNRKYFTDHRRLSESPNTFNNQLTTHYKILQYFSLLMQLFWQNLNDGIKIRKQGYFKRKTKVINMISMIKMKEILKHMSKMKQNEGIWKTNKRTATKIAKILEKRANLDRKTNDSIKEWISYRSLYV